MVLGLIAIAAELAVRLVLDDGMHFDIEMWKYARDGKRISDSEQIGHEHIPGASFRVMGVDVSINSHGMRDEEVLLAKSPAVYRILMLGDSLTFGWGVELEDTVSQRLESMFQNRGVNAEILNTGVGNTNTSMQVAYFLNKGWKFNPNLVVLNYFINDAEDTPRYRDPTFIQRHSYAWMYLKAHR